MGMFDFLKGGKKSANADLGLGDLDKDLGADLGLPELGEAPPAPAAPPPPEAPFGVEEAPPSSPKAFEEASLTPEPLNRPQFRELPTPGMPPEQQQVQQSSTGGNDMFALRKEVEVLSSKMDAIRSSLESMNQRLMNIERMAMYEREKGRKSW